MTKQLRMLEKTFDEENNKTTPITLEILDIRKLKVVLHDENDSFISFRIEGLNGLVTFESRAEEGKFGNKWTFTILNNPGIQDELFCLNTIHPNIICGSKKEVKEYIIGKGKKSLAAYINQCTSNTFTQKELCQQTALNILRELFLSKPIGLETWINPDDDLNYWLYQDRITFIKYILMMRYPSMVFDETKIIEEEDNKLDCEIYFNDREMVSFTLSSDDKFDTKTTIERIQKELD